MPLRPWHQHCGILRPDVKSQYMVSTGCKPGWCTRYSHTAVDKMPMETASASVSTPRGGTNTATLRDVTDILGEQQSPSGGAPHLMAVWCRDSNYGKGLVYHGEEGRSSGKLITWHPQPEAGRDERSLPHSYSVWDPSPWDNVTHS